MPYYFGRDTPLGSFMVRVNKFINSPQVNKYFSRLGPFGRPPPVVVQFYNFINNSLNNNIIQTLAQSNDFINNVYSRYLIEGQDNVMNLVYFFWETDI